MVVQTKGLSKCVIAFISSDHRVVESRYEAIGVIDPMHDRERPIQDSGLSVDLGDTGAPGPDMQRTYWVCGAYPDICCTVYLCSVRMCPTTLVKIHYISVVIQIPCIIDISCDVEREGRVRITTNAYLMIRNDHVRIRNVAIGEHLTHHENWRIQCCVGNTIDETTIALRIRVHSEITCI